MRVLVIEDDKVLAQSLAKALGWHFVVDVALSGSQALELVFQHTYDLVLVDYTLPDLMAPTLFEQMRAIDPRVAVIVLTGNTSQEDKIAMLDAGADDYITKPFHMDELMARIRVALRRRAGDQDTSNRLVLGDLEINVADRTVSRGGENIHLRRKDFDLLEYLVRNKGRAVTRDMILDHVWENPTSASGNLVDVHIKHLRDKIDRPYEKRVIRTVQGVGYKAEY